MSRSFIQTMGCLLLAGSFASAPAVAQDGGTLQESASRVIADLQKARQADDSGDVPFIFGHYPAPEAIVDTGAAAAATGSVGSENPPAVVAPTWKGNGTVTMRGQIMVFVNGQSYKVGDTLEGYTFKDINANEFSVMKANLTFKRPSR